MLRHMRLCKAFHQLRGFKVSCRVKRLATYIKTSRSSPLEIAQVYRGTSSWYPRALVKWFVLLPRVQVSDTPESLYHAGVDPKEWKNVEMFFRQVQYGTFDTTSRRACARDQGRSRNEKHSEVPWRTKRTRPREAEAGKDGSFATITFESPRSLGI